MLGNEARRSGCIRYRSVTNRRRPIRGGRPSTWRLGRPPASAARRLVWISPDCQLVAAGGGLTVDLVVAVFVKPVDTCADRRPGPDHHAPIVEDVVPGRVFRPLFIGVNRYHNGAPFSGFALAFDFTKAEVDCRQTPWASAVTPSGRNEVEDPAQPG